VQIFILIDSAWTDRPSTGSYTDYVFNIVQFSLRFIDLFSNCIGLVFKDEIALK
jgi:hypothetical protein